MHNATKNEDINLCGKIKSVKKIKELKQKNKEPFSSILSIIGGLFLCFFSSIFYYMDIKGQKDILLMNEWVNRVIIEMEAERNDILNQILKKDTITNDSINVGEIMGIPDTYNGYDFVSDSAEYYSSLIGRFRHLEENIEYFSSYDQELVKEINYLSIFV